MITQKKLNDLAYKIVGACIEVHKLAGPGLYEEVYHQCLEKEFKILGLNFKSELQIPFLYKGENINCKLKCDFFIEDLIVLELKSVTDLHNIHKAQTMNYMNLLKAHRSILINFKENDIDVLVTTGPPHSLHLIGLGLKKELPKLKWIADFRDPWTEISYYKHLKLTKFSDKKHRNLEKSVFETADVTLATSYTDAENFRKNGANSYCITNGFDISEPSKVLGFQNSQAGEFSVLQTTEKNNPITEHTFTMSYVGVLEQLRNPENLWKALIELCNQHPDFADNFELKLVGRVDDKILNEIENSILKSNIKNLGYLSHQDSVTEMKKSDLLLITNFPHESSKGIIPGKLFEYLATGKKIISFGPKDADVETILNKTNAGAHFDYAQTDKIKDYIFTLFLDWKDGKSIINAANINEFSRKELTKKLSEIIKKM